MEFGDPGAKNERIYTVTIFGIPDFKSSITIVHLFFGKFKVSSMLTNFVDEIKGELRGFNPEGSVAP